MGKKKKVTFIVVIGLLTLIIIGLAVMSVITGKKVSDGILNQNENNDTKRNSIEQLKLWNYDAESFHERYKGTDFEIVSSDMNIVPGTIYLCNEDSDRWVILIHGAGGDRECVIPLAEGYLQNGYNVLTYDQRGHGDNSDGRVCFGILEKNDVEALVDYARNDWNAEFVVVHGQSMGGQTAGLYAATEHAEKKADAVILDSPVPGLEILMFLMFTEEGCDEYAAKYILSCGRTYAKIVEGIDYSDGDTIEKMKDVTIPCAVILSERDETCLPEYVEQVFDNVASEKKVLIRMDSKHIEGVIDHKEKYFSNIFEFLLLIEEK
ncbi:MAG TPA: alpha/beta fold hydrolase [Lachnospiraceae bacterium]|nr:alpha/beta fold hydrolase [Lachnospiraceae bacterium]